MLYNSKFCKKKDVDNSYNIHIYLAVQISIVTSFSINVYWG